MIHFLSGLPRSGSTVLSSILNQHPEIYSSSTSGLVEIMGAACVAWESSPTTIAQGSQKEEIYKILNHIIEGKYKNIDKKIIIDKNRLWVNPQIIDTMTHVLGRPPKIIATVRSTTDCAASFVRISSPNNLCEFINNSQLINHLKLSYTQLKRGYEKYPNNILFIEYDDLIRSPQKQMNRIHEFLSISDYEYDFNNIDTKIVAERDQDAWGVTNLHSISSKLEYQHTNDTKEILREYFDEFDQPKFWIGETKDTKKKKLDKVVQLSIEGRFDESYSMLEELYKESPNCNRIKFNLGWYIMREGNLQEGINYLSFGRYERCFGNPKPPVPTPLWDGKSMGTILYYLEGGIGDQIHALKYIADMNKRGCDVIVACSAELFPIVKCCMGVKMIVEHAAAGGVYHDYWVPAMSVLVPLGYEYRDISGSPYIPKTKNPQNKRPVIGVRWQGNPKFEHEQNRRFPLKPFFDALKNIDADFICLQRDAGEEDCPEFIKKVPLNNWEQTRDAVSGCDLVISSCTSVAHLAGAMGVPTWIIVPVLNYYIWSVPGDKSPYYNSVKLFRQQKFGCWKHPMSELKKNLESQFGVAKKSKWSKLCQSILG